VDFNYIFDFNFKHIAQISASFLIASVIGFIIPFLICKYLQRSSIKEISIILAGLAIIGACAGIAGGMSRVGAVGSIIPAFLGLLGGLSIYLFGIDKSKGLIASFGASSLSISLIIAFTIGADIRNKSDDAREIRAYCTKAYTDAKLLSNETAFKRFRTQLGGLCGHVGWDLPG